MKRSILRSQFGQTSVEYMLLIVVSVSLGLAFMKKMKEYINDNPNSIVGKPLKEFENKLNQDPTGRYRVYPIGPMMR